MARVEQALEGLDQRASWDTTNLPMCESLEELHDELIHQARGGAPRRSLPETYYFALLAKAYHTTPKAVRKMPYMDVAMMGFVLEYESERTKYLSDQHTPGTQVGAQVAAAKGY